MAFGALLGGATSLALVALFFLGQRIAGLPFVPFDLFDWLARALPGAVITLFIDAIVMLIRALDLGRTSDIAKLVEQVMAIGVVVAGGAAFGAGIAWIGSRGAWPGWRVGAAGGLVLFILVTAVESSRGLGANPAPAVLWLALLLIGWGALLGNWIQVGATGGATSTMTEADRAVRRSLLAKIGAGTLGVVLASWGLDSIMKYEPPKTGAGQPLSVPAGGASLAEPTGATAGAGPRIEPAPGTRPELTPTESFYRIDINSRPLTIEGSSWALETDGLFDSPRPLTLADLMAYPAATQPITLSCISNPIGGDLIGTANWTGVRIMEVLRDLGLRPEARSLRIVASDGFFESVQMEDLMDPRTLLVYGMNGHTLPTEHGFPLRIYIPNRYGMKQPKWIKRIEAIDDEGDGYWVVRGWSREARPRVVSVIDTVATEQDVDGRVPIGGIAWAGDRGIQKVEVRVDSGPWEEAELRVPPLGPLTWIQWRYDWPRVAGRHTFWVRATDGTGAPQIEERSGAHPDGATGYHHVSRTV